MAVHHNTKQKSQILEALANHPNHVTAEEIIGILHSQGEKVGRATIYRFLRELEETGKVKKYTLGEKNTAYYQFLGSNTNCHGHYHLMCDICGKLEHLEPKVAEQFAKSALETYGFEIDCSRTVFYGKCKECVGEKA